MLFKNKPIYFTKAQSPRQSRQFDFKNKPKCFTKATQLGKLVFCAAVHCRANQVISCVPIKTFRVFQSRHVQCSNQDICCVPIKTMFVFQSRCFVCSNQDISSFPRRTIRHLSISSYHQITYVVKVNFAKKSRKKTLIQLLPLHQDLLRDEFHLIGGSFSRRT